MVAFFKKDLLRGDAGEYFLSQLYPELTKVSKAEQSLCDFLTPCGSRLELKTDFYSESSSPNFFMERYSDSKRKTPGGVFRCEDGTILLYLFYFDLKFYGFSSEQVRKAIEIIVAGDPRRYPLRDVLNNGYITQGYCIPRTLLLNMCENTFTEQIEIKRALDCGWSKDLAEAEEEKLSRRYSKRNLSK